MSAESDHDGAVKLLTEILDETASVRWRYAEAGARIDLATALCARDDTDGAILTAIPALAAGARVGLLRSIIAAGPPIFELVGDLRERARHHRWPTDQPLVPYDYLSRIVATAHSDTELAAAVATASPRHMLFPEEPLSGRELDILRLLDRGLSNKEIARNLNLTINTVKWYLKSIYTKLGVARRGESVAEARRRRILS
jgi:LuxR family maltose regulon positive regulatory protein/serine/threonine-protein kinase PknK